MVDDGLNGGTFAKEYAVGPQDEPVFHIRERVGDQGQVKHLVEHLSQGFGDVDFIADQLTKQLLDQARKWFSIIHIAGGHTKGEQLPLIVDHQVQFEANKTA